MRRRGPSREFSELRSCSGKKTVESCRNKRDADKFVFIDLECEDVIDIDYLESLQAKSRGSSTLTKDRKFKSSSFINIDDDDDGDNDEDNCASPVITVEDVGDLDSDATSSKCSFPASSKNSVTSDGGDCQGVREKGYTVKGSKCKQTHSGEAPSRNCYGFGFESESCSSDSDYSDCELIEGSYGKLHQYWEKVSQKRKHVVHNGQSGSEGQVSGSGSHSDTHANAEVANRTAHGDVPVCSSSKNGNYEKENLPDFTGTRDGHTEDSSLDPQMDGSFVESNQNVTKEDPLIYEWQSFQTNGMAGLWNEGEQSPEEHPLWSELGGRQSKHPGTCFMDNGQNFRDETNNDQRKATVLKKDEYFCKNQHSGEGPSNRDRVELRCKDDEFHDDPSSSEEKDKAVSGQPFDETQMESGFAPPEDKLGAVHEKTFSQEKASATFEEVALGNTSCHETSSNQGGFHSAREKELCDLRDQLPAEDGYVSPVRRDIAIVESDIIIDREKHKETTEYKRAIEEEMASRQRVLQIQAEEAQRLRKRRKAENMRFLDMQRRQKQRVEEVRESQKKDEENINLKDQLRAEVRKELKRLELTCIDMASLLRGLGIQVGAGFRPLPNEVHAAYKRALLKFHPDRASRSDIRQQVEAEEKFKLVSRMKEKLLLTSCY
ncbi:uncharacterized protein [Pyrus communis]|uniref:uncharacterized protein n=1 Tax=Pyrus communis TaxID=23211 RepID=UPI0035C0AEBB